MSIVPPAVSRPPRTNDVSPPGSIPPVPGWARESEQEHEKCKDEDHCWSTLQLAIHDFVLKRHGDEDLADDIASTVVTRLWRTKHDPATVKWVFVVTCIRNAIRNCWRDNRRERERRAGWGRAYVPTSVTPEQTLLEVEAWNRLANAVAILPARAHDAFVAVDLNGVTIDQLAKAWGVSPKAVEMALSRARREVRAAIHALPRPVRQSKTSAK